MVAWSSYTESEGRGSTVHLDGCGPTMKAQRRSLKTELCQGASRDSSVSVLTWIVTPQKEAVERVENLTPTGQQETINYVLLIISGRPEKWMQPVGSLQT